MWDYIVKKISSPQERHREKLPENIPPVGKEEIYTETVRNPVNSSGPPRSQPVRQDNKRILKCPVCQTVMDRIHIREVQVDECSRCGGIFLDRGELARITGTDPVTWVKAEDQESETGGLNLYAPGKRKRK